MPNYAPPAAFPVSLSLTSTNGPVPVLGSFNEWTLLQFVPPAINGDWFVSFDTPKPTGSGPTIKLIATKEYNWTLPPNTRIFIAMTDTAIQRIDFLAAPLPLNRNMLQWMDSFANILDAIKLRFLGGVLQGSAPSTTAPSIERGPRAGTYSHISAQMRGR